MKEIIVYYDKLNKKQKEQAKTIYKLSKNKPKNIRRCQFYVLPNGKIAKDVFIG